MKVFLTGATGFVGGAVVSELSEAGFELSALVRDAGVAESKLGSDIQLHEGSLAEADDLRRLAAEADVVVHLAFDYSDPIRSDRTALHALIDATDRAAHLIYTSGAWVVGDTHGVEYGDDAPTGDPSPLVSWRVAHEELTNEAHQGDDGRVTTVVRPGVVYGGKRGVTERMFSTATKHGEAHYVGDGSNHWSLIHVADLARLYRHVIEGRGHGVVQAVDGTPTRVVDVATAASHAAGAEGRVRSVPVETAREKIGPVADALCLDQMLMAPAARALGWAPRWPSFADAAAAAYEAWRS